MEKIIVLLSLFFFTSVSANAETFHFSSSDEDGKVKPTCTCPDDHPVLGWDGYCHACDEADGISMNDDNKSSCESVCNGQDGKTKRVMKGSKCVLEKCPANMPLRNSWGDCESCDADGSVSDTINCSLCPNRKIKGHSCVVADCSDRPLVDVFGNCYPCSTEHDVQVLRGKCTSICPNRFEDGSWMEEVDGKKSSGVFCQNGDSPRFSGRNGFKDW